MEMISSRYEFNAVGQVGSLAILCHGPVINRARLQMNRVVIREKEISDKDRCLM